MSRTERFVTGAWARGSRGSAWPWDRLWASYPPRTAACSLARGRRKSSEVGSRPDSAVAHRCESVRRAGARIGRASALTLRRSAGLGADENPKREAFRKRRREDVSDCRRRHWRGGGAVLARRPPAGAAVRGALPFLRAAPERRKNILGRFRATPPRNVPMGPVKARNLGEGPLFQSLD